jgi:hypothetical protein
MNQYLRRALMIAACAATLAPTGVCQKRTAKSAQDVVDGQHVVSRVPADALAEGC